MGDVDLFEVLRGETNLLERILGGTVSADPRIAMPILLAVFFALVFICLRVVFKDKGKSEMSEEELEEDRAIFRGPLERHADFRGRKVNYDLLDTLEAEEIAKGKRLSGKE